MFMSVLFMCVQACLLASATCLACHTQVRAADGRPLAQQLSTVDTTYLILQIAPSLQK
jgi:hypothetical protein